MTKPKRCSSISKMQILTHIRPESALLTSRIEQQLNKRLLVPQHDRFHEEAMLPPLQPAFPSLLHLHVKSASVRSPGSQTDNRHIRPFDQSQAE